MRKLVILYYTFITLIIPGAGIALASTSEKTYALKEGCTRYCHNKGCPHDAVLPDFITSNSGYFGDVVRWLHAVGHQIDGLLGVSGAGYGIINLLLFCVMVPVVHLTLASFNIWLAGRLR